MARRYYRRRYYKKRYTPKGKRVLKKGSIFGNKSAKSQAKQIYYLNKKINYINKKVKPEIDTITSNIVFESNLVDNRPVKTFDRRYPLFKDYIINETVPEYISNRNYTLSMDQNTNWINIKSITLYGNFGFSEDNSYTTDYATLPNGLINSKAPKSAYLKIFVCRTKTGGSSFPGRLTTKLVPSTVNVDSTAYSDLNLIQGPLIKDLSKRIDVLRIKTIKITDTYPEKMYKIKLTKNINYKKVPGTDFNSGEIFIYVQYVCPTMLQYQNSTTQVVTKISPAIHWCMNCKIVYNKSEGLELVPPVVDLPTPNPNES